MSSAAASLHSHQKPIGTLFWHPTGGGIHHRWPSSSFRCSPGRGGSSSPSGLRVCASSYVFDLSLPLSLSVCVCVCRVLDLAQSWCIASFAIIVGSYDGLSFPFEVILSDWVFMDLRTLDVCLACAYLRWQLDIHVIYLMYVLVINLRVPWPRQLMHRGSHTFLFYSPVETLGHSLK